MIALTESRTPAEEVRARLAGVLGSRSAGDRRRRGHRPLGEGRRPRRRGPDPRLQLGPLPHGRHRLQRRHAPARRRQRDHDGHGRAGDPARRPRRPGDRRRQRHRPDAQHAALPRAGARRGVRGGHQLPDDGDHRRPLAPEPGGDRVLLRARGRHDRRRGRARALHDGLHVHRRRGAADGVRGRRRRRRAPRHDRGRADRRRPRQHAVARRRRPAHGGRWPTCARAEHPASSSSPTAGRSRRPPTCAGARAHLRPGLRRRLDDGAAPGRAGDRRHRARVQGRAAPATRG